MFFHQHNGIIALGKAKNFLSLLIPKHIIILIIKRLGIILSISRIIVINIPSFLPLTEFIQSNHYHYGLNIGGSSLEQKLVFYHLLFATNFWIIQRLILLLLLSIDFPQNFISFSILIFLGLCLGITISSPQKIMCIIPNLLMIILDILFVLLQSNGGINILMMISLQRLINYAQTNF
jgi:hypothetical protein